MSLDTLLCRDAVITYPRETTDTAGFTVWDYDTAAREPVWCWIEQRSGREYRLVLPAGTALSSACRVEVAGATYAVAEAPSRPVTPAGGEHHVEATATLVGQER